MRTCQGFTLVELLLVMALLALVMAISAPALSRSMRERHLADEAARFLALTEYARNEAISQGVPTTVWIEAASGRFGAEPKAGFAGDARRVREFTVNEDVHFEMENAGQRNGLSEAIEFAPDGSPEETSIESVRMVDRFGSAFTIARTIDRYGYEILADARQ